MTCCARRAWSFIGRVDAILNEYGAPLVAWPAWLAACSERSPTKKEPRERPCKEWSHDETIEEKVYLEPHMMASTMSCLLKVLVLRSKMPMMSVEVAL